MKRTRLRNKFLKDRNKENKRRYSKQRNYCVSLIRKMKKDYYSNLDIKKVTDNKTFQRTIKPIRTRFRSCFEYFFFQSGKTDFYQSGNILPATIVGRRRTFFISNRLKRLEKLNICRGQEADNVNFRHKQEFIKKLFQSLFLKFQNF